MERIPEARSIIPPPTGAILQIQHAVGTTDASTSSSTWTDVPEMSITINTGNSILLIIAQMDDWFNKSAPGVCTVACLLDGVVVQNSTVGDSSSNWHSGSHVIVSAREVSAGMHTVNLQWAITYGSGIANNRVASGYEYRELVVIEVAK